MSKPDDDIKAILGGIFLLIIMVGFGVHQCCYHTDPQYRANHDKGVAEREEIERTKKQAPQRIKELEEQVKALREQLPPPPLEK